MMIHLVRVLFLLAVLVITVSFAYQPDVYSEGADFVTYYILVPAFATLAIVLADMLWKRKRLQILSGLFFGLLAGLVVAFVLGLLVDMAVELYAPDGARSPIFDRTVELVRLLVGAAAVFMCVSFVLQTKDSFRFILPYVEFSKEMRGARPLLLDTSVIIDGRIADIAETRILESNVVVPRFVLDELQAVADSSDKLKRNRGRRGLDVLNRLRNSDKLTIQIMEVGDEEMAGESGVDAKLVALAKRVDGRVVTNDYNLNKIAELRGVAVININDLANAVKPVMLPGETMTVRILRPGDEAGQGVGYLDDGTMVVVENARDHVDSEVRLIVTSALQTSAGRMIFGKMDV